MTTFSRRPVPRMNRGRIATAVASWSPSQLSTGVENWLIEDLVSLGNGVVAPTWTGRQLGTVLSPYSGDTDVGTVQLQEFLGDGATQTAGLRLTSRAGKTISASIASVFNGANKVWDVWMLCQLNTSVTNIYWSAGNQSVATEYCQARYSAAGVIKNNLALRAASGAINVIDNMTEYAVMSPQLHRWRRTGNIVTLYVDEISQGSTPVRNAGPVIDQFYIGCPGTGPDGAGSLKASAYSINAFGITTGMSASDITSLASWVYPRAGIGWKKGLNP